MLNRQDAKDAKHHRAQNPDMVTDATAPWVLLSSRLRHQPLAVPVASWR
jgi:hypothetical protein